MSARQRRLNRKKNRVIRSASERYEGQPTRYPRHLHVRWAGPQDDKKLAQALKQTKGWN